MVPLQLWYYHVPYSNEMSPSVMYKLKFTEQIHPHQTLTPPPPLSLPSVLNPIPCYFMSPREVFLLF